MKKHVLILLWSMLLAMRCADADHLAATEYEIKAAFIYNFAKFVDWPASLSPEISLCILGKDSFADAFEDFQGKPVGGKKFTARRIAAPGEAKSCAILFISSSEKDNLGRILGAVKGFNLLTVGDTEGFAQHGVMINLYLEGGKVRFELNLEAVRSTGLRMSSRLLQLGKIVVSCGPFPMGARSC